MADVWYWAGEKPAPVADGEQRVWYWAGVKPRPVTRSVPFDDELPPDTGGGDGAGSFLWRMNPQQRLGSPYKEALSKPQRFTEFGLNTSKHPLRQVKRYPKR